MTVLGAWIAIPLLLGPNNIPGRYMTVLRGDVFVGILKEEYDINLITFHVIGCKRKAVDVKQGFSNDRIILWFLDCNPITARTYNYYNNLHREVTSHKRSEKGIQM